MEKIQFGDIANVISAISGLMTIFGFGGFLSWSFFRKEKGSLAENSISIFAFAVKTGFCFLLLWPFSAIFFAFHILVALSLGPNIIGGSDFFWSPAYPFAYLASYSLSTMLLVPVYILCCASAYTSSLVPFKLFFQALKGSRAKH